MLPAAWRGDLGKPREITEGMSDAAVFRVAGARYLKLAAGAGPAAALSEEIARTRFLAGHGIRVPEVLRVHEQTDFTALLMTALPGLPADRHRGDPAALVPRLATALRALHRLPADDCPFDESVTTRLARARIAIAEGEIDAADFADRNASSTPRQLYDRLAAKRPREISVVAHGDATLANLIVGDDGTVGFIDCGRCGRADAYLDLAVLADGLAEHWGDGCVAAFAAAYGVAWDDAKAAYFSDLYELF